jgi:hypothetical protein
MGPSMSAKKEVPSDGETKPGGDVGEVGMIGGSEFGTLRSS